MRTGLIVSGLVGLLLAAPKAAADDKGVPELGTRYAKGQHEIVAPEEREALGLDERTWAKDHGKVHPDVYKALEKTEPVVGKPWLDSGSFVGMVYVQVQLNHTDKGERDSAENKAAIKQLQSKVLAQLTASEFSVEYPFQTLAGILGYVNRAGLEKLKANVDVVGVCLDDKPFPRLPLPVFRQDLPPLEPGDPSTQPAQGRFWGNGGKIEKEVYQALGLNERVFVLIIAKYTRSSEPLSAKFAHGAEIEDRVLSGLTADEFWVRARVNLVPCIGGLVNKDALRKLEQHPDVEFVGIQPRLRSQW